MADSSTSPGSRFDFPREVCLWRCSCGHQEFSREKPPQCWCGRDLHRVLPSNAHAPNIDGRALTLAEAPGELSAPHPTGLAELDNALGGGLVIPGSVVVWGDPGSGKTTLAFHFVRSLRRVLLAPLEMSVPLYRYAARRGGMDPARVILAEGREPRAWIARARAERCPALLVDSLGKVPDPVATMAELADSARRGWPELVVAVAHTTRAGDARGGADLEHEPDTLLHLAPGKVTIRKHRMGPGGEVRVAWPP